MSAPDEITLQLPTGRVAARVWGPPDGAPVLALHGWLDNAASFDRLAPLLPGLRIVAMDLPGHGRSDHRAASASYHYIDWVRDALHAVDALGWDRFALLGHSMGAGISALLAGTFPERVERAVLLDGIGPLSAPADEAASRLRKHLNLLLGQRRRRPRRHGSPEAAALRVVQASTGLSDASARLLVARGSHPVGDGVAWSWDRRIRLPSPGRLTEAQVHAFLDAIECPVLLIVAEHGYPFGEEHFDTRARCIRHLQRVDLPGHHHVHMDDAQRVAEHVRPFLEAEHRAPDITAPSDPLRYTAR